MQLLQRDFVFDGEVVTLIEDLYHGMEDLGLSYVVCKDGVELGIIYRGSYGWFSSHNKHQAPIAKNWRLAVRQLIQ